MGNFSLRRYDTQARVGIVLSLAAVVTMVALAYCVFRGLNLQEMVILYGKNRPPAVYLSGLVTLGLSIAGFGFGWNSAGQRRNDRQRLSWGAFFIGAIVIVLTLVLLFVFRERGESVLH